jgi:hypothetical protein
MALHPDLARRRPAMNRGPVWTTLNNPNCGTQIEAILHTFHEWMGVPAETPLKRCSGKCLAILKITSHFGSKFGCNFVLGFQKDFL